MDIISQSAIHIAHNLTEKAIAAIPPHTRARLLEAVHQIASKFTTAWVVDHNDRFLHFLPMAVLFAAMACRRSVSGAIKVLFQI